MCSVPCPDKTIYYEGLCIELTPENCPGIIDATGTQCIMCKASEGLVESGNECVCDPSKFLAPNNDDTCTACVSPLLRYDADAGSCVCANGAKHVLVDGEVRCTDECGRNEIPVDGECVSGDECAKIAEYDDGREQCL